MSFTRIASKVDHGDTIIVYLGHDNLQQFEVNRGKTYQTKYGAIKHDELIGFEYGKKLQLSRGYVYILRPTPEMWTLSLKHRTQILYTPDISIIVFQLDLRPGKVVIESGTGSASLSHALLRAVHPTGHLHTFDFHAQRSEIALDELKRHGYDSSVLSVKHRDVCQEGFGIVNAADAVFLDLPKPWLAIPFAKESLVPGGRICSFSPCWEQVQKCCEALRSHKFTDIETLECLSRPLDVRAASLPIADLGHPDDGSLDCQLRDVQPMIGKLERIDDSRNNPPKSKTPRGGENGRPFKKAKLEEAEECKNDEASQGSLDAGEPNTDATTKKTKACLTFKTAVPALQMPGHTGFLTFATLYPE